jgi:hypothetical protein
MAWRRWVVQAMLVVACLVASAAQAQALPEAQVKAAFVFKFGDYVEWPPDAFARADDPVVFGVVGADRLADELARLAVGRKVGGRPVVVRKLAVDDALVGLHVVFVGGDDPARVAAALAAARDKPVLTVTEAREGAAAGMINFVVVAGKVRFDVALPPAEAAQLKISSRLLAVARRVVPP